MWFANIIISTAELEPRSPITRRNTANRKWGISPSIQYGTSPAPIMDTAAGTVDAGSTLVVLASGTVLLSTEYGSYIGGSIA
jgi:hypothetical protein